MPINKVIPLLVLLVLGAYGAGCGGGGDSTSATEEGTLSKVQFIKMADAICRKADVEQIEVLEQEGKAKRSHGLEELVVNVSVPPAEKELKGIEELQAPAGDQQEIEAILQEFRRAIKRTEENPKAAMNSGLTAVNQRAAKFGFKDCSEPL
jgi:hypothetical protein